MKKRILLLCIGLIAFNAQAQKSTTDEDDVFVRKGRILIETGYDILGGFGFGSGTGISSYSDQDDNTISAIGIDGGYFLSENFALKLKYSSIGSNGNTLSSIGVGAKYYIIGKIPLDIGFSNLSGGGDSERLTSFTAGYAFRLADNITLEPSIGAIASEADDAIGTFKIKFAMFL